MHPSMEPTKGGRERSARVLTRASTRIHLTGVALGTKITNVGGRGSILSQLPQGDQV